MVGWVGYRAAAAAVMLLLGLQACTGETLPDSALAQPSPEVTVTAVPTVSAPPLLTDEGFAWVPFGPAESTGAQAWYASLEQGNCAGVKNDANDTLVQALAAVCQAAISKQRSDWDVAQ